VAAGLAVLVAAAALLALDDRRLANIYVADSVAESFAVALLADTNHPKLSDIDARAACLFPALSFLLHTNTSIRQDGGCYSINICGEPDNAWTLAKQLKPVVSYDKIQCIQNDGS